MTQELQTNVLPKEDGRLRRLTLDVQAGRNGWGAELTQVGKINRDIQNVTHAGEPLVSGGTGTRVAQETEANVMKLQGVEHVFHGEFYVVPQRTLELGAQAWEQATEAAVALTQQRETTVASLQSKDRQYVTSRLPEVRAHLDKLRSNGQK